MKRASLGKQKGFVLYVPPLAARKAEIKTGELHGSGVDIVQQRRLKENDSPPARKKKPFGDAKGRKRAF